MKLIQALCKKKNLKMKLLNNVSCSFFSSDTAEPKSVGGCCKTNDPLMNEMIQLGQSTQWTHPHLFDIGYDQVTPGISKQEFETRRNTYAKYLTNYQNYFFKTSKPQLGYLENKNTNFIAIIPSNMTTFMGPDVPHPFKQNSDFLYLTGFKEPNSVLVLSKTDKTDSGFKSTLFVRDKDPKKELWDGAFSGPESISKLCGIDQALGLNEFETYLNCLVKEVSNKKITLWRYPTEELMQDGANANCLNEPIENVISKFYEDNSEKLILMNDIDKETSVLNTSRYFVQLARAKKSPAEIKIMRRACEIASNAFVSTMYASHPMVNEHLLYAKFDYETRIRGADYLAYIPVVAGGPRATVLHYIRNDQLIMNNRLVLMDAGCQYRDYCSDITRTWPVTGKFSGAQREVYEACLNVQTYCIEQCRIGTSINDLYTLMMKKLGTELVQLGILKKNDVDINNPKLTFDEQKKIGKYCPHDIGHYLGLDVHDCPEVSKSIQFEAGTVITVEPGN
jgi:Xaa-Pro aminopeptidase